MDELQAALRLRETKDTTSGQDDITVSMMRYLPQSALSILLELINTSWRKKATSIDVETRNSSSRTKATQSLKGSIVIPTRSTDVLRMQNHGNND